MDTKTFILNFFKLEDGIRCRVRHEHKGGFVHYKDDTTKLRSVRKRAGRYGYPMTDINAHNYDREFSKPCTQHFFAYIFDEGIRTCEKKEEVADHIIGVTCVMDIDTPRVHHQTSNRQKAFGYHKDSILAKFEVIRLLAKKELEDAGLWDDTRMLWSGNGYYIILPDFYGDKMAIAEHTYNFVGMEMFINEQAGFSENLVDQREMAWNRYYKIPLTRHQKYPDRFSVPIRKDKPVCDGFDATDWGV